MAPRTKVVLQSRQFSSSSSPDTPRTKVVLQSRQFSASSSPDAVPATKSAHGGSQSAAPATKSAHGGSQSAVPAKKSTHGGAQSAVPATKSAHGGSQSAAPTKCCTCQRESLTHKLLTKNQKLSCSKHLVSQVSQRPESKTEEKAGKRHAHFSPHT